MRQRVLILCTHNSASSGKIGCCGGSCDGDPVTSNLYDPVESSVIPEKAVLAFPDREIGIRIEDTFVVREGGVETLCRGGYALDVRFQERLKGRAQECSSSIRSTSSISLSIGGGSSFCSASHRSSRITFRESRYDTRLPTSVFLRPPDERHS